MNVSVVLAHPQSGSFNHAIAQCTVDTLLKKGHKAFFHDLYKEKFDPVLPYYEIQKESEIDPVISRYCDELKSSGGIVIIHPNWWGQPPAILKGWIDRVIRPGVAYEFDEGDGGEGVPRGLLTGKIGLVFNTSNTPSDREQEVFGDPLEAIWRKCIFEFCGVASYYRKMFNVVVTSTLEERRRWLAEVEDIVIDLLC